jgi:hypothetical protein
MPSRHTLLRRTGTVTLAVAALAAAALPAWASTSPTSPEPGPAPVVATPATVGAIPSSQWQTNGPVWSLAVTNGTLFAGGEFTSVRPPGAALGTSETPAGGLAAFTASTGSYISTFHHTVDGRVAALTVSPDGKTLYAGGAFAFVDGVSHNKVAAFDLTQAGDPLLPWDPKVGGGEVRALSVAADSGSVFLGGAFTTMGGLTRSRLAQVSASTGTPTSFAPSVTGAGVDA